MTDAPNSFAGKEADFLAVDIACLNPDNLHATLVSTAGSHCDVWRSNKRGDLDEHGNPYFEFVIKYPCGEHNRAEIAMLANHYGLLKDALEDVIPPAVFFITKVDGQPNVVVLAKAVNIWFDIANPQNREEAVELLKTNPKPRHQLRRFISAAKEWRAGDNPRLIDLFGVDNLVMDIDREVRYLDSFFVFFFEDMLDLLDEWDEVLEYRFNVTRERLAYLDRILEQAEAVP